jgi:hypothetical protein
MLTGLAVKDAFEVMALFQARRVPQYEHVTVKYLFDPVEKDPQAMPWCVCSACKQTKLERLGLY